MKKLTKNQYSIVRHLFSEDYPNITFVFSIIDLIIEGEIWVNDIETPTICLVITGRGYCYLTGEINENNLKACLEILKTKKDFKVVIPQHFDFATFGLLPLKRRQYRFKNIPNEIPAFENTSGFSIHKIDNLETFNQCGWKTIIINFYGSAENFLNHGIGFVLWDEENHIIASEAYGILSKEYLEVATHTHQDYQGKNLSTILCNHLIHYSIQNHLTPVWSCNDDNIASWKVAEKQGFDQVFEYQFYTFENCVGI